MISGINLNAVMDYTCKKDKTNPTIWKIGAIPSRALAGITTEAPVDKLIEVARLGIKGWENFKVADKEIEFKTDKNGLDGTLIDVIPIDILIELGTQILTLQKLTDKEIKN